ILDVLPGQYNKVVHAEETSPQYNIIDASNDWVGLKPYDSNTIMMKQKKEYVSFGSAYSGVVVTHSNAYFLRNTKAIEVKMRAHKTSHLLFLGVMYDFSQRKWTMAQGENFTVVSDEVPRVGEWDVWKRTYDEAAGKTNLYINGKKILVIEGKLASSGGNSGEIIQAGAAPGQATLDIESMYGSNNATAFVFAPKVNQVTDADTKITGTGKPGAAVMVEVDGVSGKYKGTADEQGNFSIDIPKQKADAKLTVTQSAEGTTSEKTV
ncbi:TPA: Ig-like domain-containing protein, partial [Bacillus cereus]